MGVRASERARALVIAFIIIYTTNVQFERTPNKMGRACDRQKSAGTDANSGPHSAMHYMGKPSREAHAYFFWVHMRLLCAGTLFKIRAIAALQSDVSVRHQPKLRYHRRSLPSPFPPQCTRFCLGRHSFGACQSVQRQFRPVARAHFFPSISRRPCV